MPDRDLVVIGGSLGALEAVTNLLAGLSADLPAALLIVVTPARARDFEIFDRAGPLPAVPAVEGDLLRPGRVYVAGPDRHLLVGPDNRVRLSAAAHYNRLRPAIDPLLLSAARWAGPRTVGVPMSGVFDDGIAGLAALGMQGGLIAVQDPEEAAYPDLTCPAQRCGCARTRWVRLLPWPRLCRDC
ncbi:chemotaxis protein CheB [Actinoplanes sp. NPDC024001]|uniref:chemotaxis protein CheB n=1 Tax=Actinoplanes sp. NPDC024001 TaxID=3154598 RepID=UPI0033D38172